MFVVLLVQRKRANIHATYQTTNKDTHKEQNSTVNYDKRMRIIYARMMRTNNLSHSDKPAQFKYPSPMGTIISLHA